MSAESESDDDWMIRCSDCANCAHDTISPELFGCYCYELGEIYAHETVGACSYFIERTDKQ